MAPDGTQKAADRRPGPFASTATTRGSSTGKEQEPQPQEQEQAVGKSSCPVSHSVGHWQSSSSMSPTSSAISTASSQLRASLDHSLSARQLHPANHASPLGSAAVAVARGWRRTGCSDIEGLEGQRGNPCPSALHLVLPLAWAALTTPVRCCNRVCPPQSPSPKTIRFQG